MWEQHFLDELSSYIGFSADNAESLRHAGPHVQPKFKGIVDRFYEAIFAHPRVAAVLTGGQAQIDRQKALLTDWMAGLFSGVYDAEYIRRRARIGRTHVRIQLDQRYMFSAMNLVRAGLHDALKEATLTEEARSFAHASLDKLLDLELAIMLETYAEDHLSRMRDVERLAMLGQLSGFIGHELRNPLAVMETSLHLLQRRLPIGDDKATHHMGRLREQVSLAGGIISDLVELARDRPLQRKPLRDLPALFEAARGEVPGAHDAAVELVVAADLPAPSVDEKQLRRLIVNLLSNALQAVAGRPDPRIRVSAASDDDKLLLIVEDNGPGVAEEVRYRLFEPLTTTRPKGLGLGLALCRRIAERHGGDIRALVSPELGGARFEVRLAQAFGGGASEGGEP